MIDAENNCIYSRLSSRWIAEQILPLYPLTRIVRCQYYVFGLHDNYIVEDGEKRYILRIYRNDWRSREEALFELDLLNFLGKTVPVAFPIATKDGNYCLFVNCPEGERAVALFNFAPGTAPCDQLTVPQSRLLGQATARVHAAADGFSTQYRRQVLDMPYLLDTSIDRITDFVKREDALYLKDIQTKIKANLPALPMHTPEFGVCIGDVNPSNFHITAQQRLTLFDFDQCGYGWRSFDIGKFIASIQTNRQKRQLADAFVQGYINERPLSDDETASIPYFVETAIIWVMAIHVCNAERIGYKFLDDDAFWNRWMSTLKKCGK
jgi:Ser/Thr protein kinase RdoA (MazF antagonist)